MKTYKRIQISKAEGKVLYDAEEVLKSIADRFSAANGGGFYSHLEIKSEVKYCAEGFPRVWYTVHPDLEMLQSGHHTSLELALDEMYGKGEPHVKREQAARLKCAAERLEEEARKLESLNKGVKTRI